MKYPAESLLADLLWLLEERELFVCDEPLAVFLQTDWRTRFAKLSAAPTPLIEHMAAAKSHFLGTYFEQLFSFAVHRFTTLEVLAEHEQIQGASKTLGEVDLLVRDQAGRVLQFEIALKFYLERPDLYPNDWIGPNKNDSLAKKVSHARQHQLAILTLPEGQEWLIDTALSGKVTPNLMIYGRHFYALSGNEEAFFAGATKDSAWIRLSNLEALAPFLCELQEACKPHWMTPGFSAYTSKQINHSLLVELSERFVEDSRPILFSCRKCTISSKNDIFWLFVCPDEW